MFTARFTARLDILSNVPWQASACWQQPGAPGLMSWMVDDVRAATCGACLYGE